MQYVGIYDRQDTKFHSVIDTFEAKDIGAALRKASKRAAQHDASVRRVSEAQAAPIIVPGPKAKYLKVA